LLEVGVLADAVDVFGGHWGALLVLLF